MQKKYVVGLDYGTLSGRAVVVSCEDGKVLASAVKAYEHGVLNSVLPGGEALPAGEWALQVPQDYLDVLETVVPEAVKNRESVQKISLGWELILHPVQSFLLINIMNLFVCWIHLRVSPMLM